MDHIERVCSVKLTRLTSYVQMSGPNFHWAYLIDLHCSVDLKRSTMLSWADQIDLQMFSWSGKIDCVQLSWQDGPSMFSWADHIDVQFTAELTRLTLSCSVDLSRYTFNVRLIWQDRLYSVELSRLDFSVQLSWPDWPLMFSWDDHIDPQCSVELTRLTCHVQLTLQDRMFSWAEKID